jgi:hypothetical protein
MCTTLYLYSDVINFPFRLLTEAVHSFSLLPLTTTTSLELLCLDNQYGTPFIRMAFNQHKFNTLFPN